MTLRKLMFVAIASVAMPVRAADVLLGPEKPISTITTEAAAYGQSSPRVAWNGDGFVAVWTDGRQERWGTTAIYGTQLDSTGSPLDRFGHVVAPSGRPAIASNGRNYLVVSGTYTTTVTQVLDADGYPLGDPQAVPFHGVRQLVSNGNSYLLATDEGYVLLDGSGHVLRTVDLRFRFADGGTAAKDGKYFLIGFETTGGGQPDTPITMHVVDNTGTLVLTRYVGPTLSPGRQLTTAFGSQNVFVAWSSDPTTSAQTSAGFETFDYTGTITSPAALLPQVPSLNFTSLTSGWDGEQFLLAFASANGASTSAVRVRPDGVVVDQQPFVLSTEPAATPQFAHNGRSTVMVWATWDIWSRTLHSFDELVSTPNVRTLVTYSAPVQTDVDLVANGSEGFAAWSEFAAKPRIVGSINGTLKVLAEPRTIGLSAPVVARGNRSYLVAWYDWDSDSVFARRIALDGSLLDERPLTVGQSTWGYPYRKLAAVWTGNSFLVVWSAGPIVGRRIDEDGKLLDSEALILLSADRGMEGLEWPALARTASGLQLAASGHVFSMLDPGMTPPPPTRIWATSVGPNGDSSPVTEPVVASGSFSGNEFAVGSVAIAWTGDRVIVMWTEHQNPDSPVPCISAMQLSSTGGSMAPAQTLRCFAPSMTTPTLKSADIAWNGIEHVVVWSEVTGGIARVFAIRLNRELVPLDDSPIAISPEGSNAFPVRVVATPGGVMIAYSRLEHTAGDVPRAFTRVLLRSDFTSARRRSARP